MNRRWHASALASAHMIAVGAAAPAQSAAGQRRGFAREPTGRAALAALGAAALSGVIGRASYAACTRRRRHRDFGRVRDGLLDDAPARSDVLVHRTQKVDVHPLLFPKD